MDLKEKEKIKSFLEKSRREHHSCADGWYSCPLHPEGTTNPYLKECNCGAEKYNTELDKILEIFDKI